MDKITFLFYFLTASALCASAESWDQICTSGDYYYGVGTGATESEADHAAIADLARQIATHVSADFTQIDDITTKNGEIDHTSRVLNCVNTYSQTTLTNTERWPTIGKAPEIVVRRYLKRSELIRIYENRITKARNMLSIANECLDKKKIDMALQYYYWAYSLIRSVQFPDEVKDTDGRILVDRIPVKINEILSDIAVVFDNRDGGFIDLLFTYKGAPVSSLEFSYSDGRATCHGMAKDGRGMIEMIPGYETDVYHVDIEYEYKSQARGDAEMQSVLEVITPKTFAKAALSIHSVTKSVGSETLAQSTESICKEVTDNATAATGGLMSAKSKALNDAIEAIVEAIVTKRYSDAMPYFTVEGLEMYNRLISYGSARIVGKPEIKYYNGLEGRTVARGLQMSFSFTGQQKKTFVENISFTFNPDNRIENVAFGLGKIAEDGIFNKKASGWSDDVREIIVEFMENYKTAYSLERLDYIESIFADDAVIIVGNVARRKPKADIETGSVSLAGQNVISYNRYTKDSYIKSLKRCFGRNDFINLRFTDHQVQWLEKYDNQSIFAINIRQEYCSSTYADDGYLFLLVDMTDRNEPQIKVRTWQPNEVAIDKLYNAGDFFND